MVRWAVSIFKFFASLGLALFLLLALAAIFAVGTFIESAYGMEAARLLIYRSPWMSALLVGLALNVAAAALDRLPWKKKHVGFVVTHAGIILILAGSLVTRASGVEGQMAIQEGETESRMILDEPLLQLFSHPSGSLVSLSLPRQAFPWQGREKLHENPDLWLLRYYPKASREERVEPAPNGPAALQVELESSWMKVNHWLFLDDPERNRILLGPAELRFTQEKMVPQAASALEGVLEFHWGEKTIQVPVDSKKLGTFPLEGTPYRVTLLRIFKDARVEGNQLVDQSSEWKNPACEVLLEGKGVQEKHTLFSEFPDFPTLHGLQPSASGVRIFYRRGKSRDGSRTVPGVQNELRFVWRENGLPLYQIRKGEEVREGEAQEGKEYETGWMDFRFRVSHYYPHARREADFSPEPVESEAEEHLSAIQLEVEEGENKKLLWLGQGDKEEILFRERPFFLIYGLRMKPVGFRLRLRDFRAAFDPGTTRPASFESDVTLEDDSAGTNQDFTIRMNQPLRYNGFKIFQSGYQQPEGGPEVSVFTVAKDPGIPVKYAGAVVLIGGILTMFYSKRFSRRAGEEISVTNRTQGAVTLPGRQAGAPLLLGLFFAALFLPAFSFPSKPSAEEILRKIPVQSGGRVKPFESFAQEVVLSVTGKRESRGTARRAPTMVVWNWIANPETWHTKSFIPVRHPELQKEFSLRVIGGKISPELVLTHAPFQAKVEEAHERQKRKEPLTPLERKRMELDEQARLFQAIAQGLLPGFFPPPESPKGGWLPLETLAASELPEVQAALSHLVFALRAGERDPLDSAQAFSVSLEKLLVSRGVAPPPSKIQAELFYNQFRPFQWAWILYLASTLGCLFFRGHPEPPKAAKDLDPSAAARPQDDCARRLLRPPKNGGLAMTGDVVSYALFLAGFGFHTFGFVLRCFIAGRPPVTNMYESVIWVAWAAALFSLGLWFFYRKPVLAASAAGVASFTLLIGESFPALLDPSLSPLVPVLRNNYWLTVHVLTITLSYGAFALAWGLAHAALVRFAFRPEQKEDETELADYVYRALQIGVVLLAAGTILGGVWANDSWGRFWGWDPKETWALIALFGYLAVLHGRFSGRVGAFGTVLGAIFAFLGVLMAWYGVNFVLAAGFHSYGFGGGGLPYVLAAVLLDLLFVSFLAFRYNKFRAMTGMYER